MNLFEYVCAGCMSTITESGTRCLPTRCFIKIKSKGKTLKSSQTLAREQHLRKQKKFEDKNLKLEKMQQNTE